MSFLYAGIGFVMFLVFAFFLIKHFLSIRDKEWAMWAMDHGLMSGFPKYGYVSKEYNLND